jgi:ABC-type uncharacterized transport system permease subunit
MNSPNIMMKAYQLNKGRKTIMAQVQTEVKKGNNMRWGAGITGSLVGGLMFGVMMAMMGMLTKIAGMMGSDSAVVGFIIHMMISFIFGIVFTVFTGMTRWNGILSGLVFGVVLWFLFPFILMPMMMGNSDMAFKFTTDSMMSLVGHMVYGIITGIVYSKMAKR